MEWWWYGSEGNAGTTYEYVEKKPTPPEGCVKKLSFSSLTFREKFDIPDTVIVIQFRAVGFMGGISKLPSGLKKLALCSTFLPELPELPEGLEELYITDPEGHTFDLKRFPAALVNLHLEWGTLKSLPTFPEGLKKLHVSSPLLMEIGQVPRGMTTMEIETKQEEFVFPSPEKVLYDYKIEARYLSVRYRRGKVESIWARLNKDVGYGESKKPKLRFEDGVRQYFLNEAGAYCPGGRVLFTNLAGVMKEEQELVKYEYDDNGPHN